VPIVPNHLNWLLDSDRCLARSGDGTAGRGGDRQHRGGAALRPGFPATPISRSTCRCISRRQPAPATASARGLAPALASLEVRLLPDGVLPHLAAGVVTGDPINLLAGPVRAAHQRRSPVEALAHGRRSARGAGCGDGRPAGPEAVAPEGRGGAPRRGDHRDLPAGPARRAHGGPALPGRTRDRRRAGHGACRQREFPRGSRHAGPRARRRAGNHARGDQLSHRRARPAPAGAERRFPGAGPPGGGAGRPFTATIQQANQRADGVEGRIQLTGGGA
jgi:general secretion pathway protein L